MSRINRVDVGNVVYHVINRANARVQIFDTDEDYRLFIEVLEEARQKFEMRILSFCIMPNHWHLVLYPREDGDLQKFTGWISMTHTQRWHVKNRTVGSGHLYQGRYKSFPIETNEYLLQLFRYVERNALRARLVKRAQHWKWSSLYVREEGTQKEKKLLSQWPIDMPNEYINLINNPQTDSEMGALRNSVNRGKPYGTEMWVSRMINKFDLVATLRNPGRPKNGS